jgi:hypothetical protein
VHLDIEPSEVPKIITARSPGQEKIIFEIFILPGSPHYPTLTSCFSTFFRYFQSGASGVLGTPERLRARLGLACKHAYEHVCEHAYKHACEYASGYAYCEGVGP